MAKKYKLITNIKDKAGKSQNEQTLILAQFGLDIINTIGDSNSMGEHMDKEIIETTVNLANLTRDILEDEEEPELIMEITALIEIMKLFILKVEEKDNSPMMFDVVVQSIHAIVGVTEIKVQ